LASFHGRRRAVDGNPRGVPRRRAISAAFRPWAAASTTESKAGQRGDEHRRLPRSLGWRLQQARRKACRRKKPQFGLARRHCASKAAPVGVDQALPPTAIAAGLEWRWCLGPASSARPARNSSRSPKGLGSLGSGVLAPGLGRGLRPPNGWSVTSNQTACCCGGAQPAQVRRPAGVGSGRRAAGRTCSRAWGHCSRRLVGGKGCWPQCRVRGRGAAQGCQQGRLHRRAGGGLTPPRPQLGIGPLLPAAASSSSCGCAFSWGQELLASPGQPPLQTASFVETEAAGQSQRLYQPSRCRQFGGLTGTPCGAGSNHTQPPCFNRAAGRGRWGAGANAGPSPRTRLPANSAPGLGKEPGRETQWPADRASPGIPGIRDHGIWGKRIWAKQSGQPAPVAAIRLEVRIF